MNKATELSGFRGENKDYYQTSGIQKRGSLLETQMKITPHQSWLKRNKRSEFSTPWHDWLFRCCGGTLTILDSRILIHPPWWFLPASYVSLVIFWWLTTIFHLFYLARTSGEMLFGFSEQDHQKLKSYIHHLLQSRSTPHVMRDLIMTKFEPCIPQPLLVLRTTKQRW